MPEEPTSPPASPTPPAGPPATAERPPTFGWPLALTLIFFFGLIAYVLSLKSCQQAHDSLMGGATNLMNQASSIAARFMKGTITQTFTADIPKLTSTGMGNLELGIAESTENFRRTDGKTALWDTVYLGTTTTEIKVPVTYRYHLQLADPWQLDVSGQTCVVIAPKIRPSLPPAIHTDRMEKRSDRGWARFNEIEQMNEMERSITPTLRRYAGDEKHLGLARETCRKTVAEFVKNWLLKEDHWRKDRFHSIKVIFEDEVGKDVEQLPPTITILKD